MEIITTGYKYDRSERKHEKNEKLVREKMKRVEFE